MAKDRQTTCINKRLFANLEIEIVQCQIQPITKSIMNNHLKMQILKISDGHKAQKEMKI